MSTRDNSIVEHIASHINTERIKKIGYAFPYEHTKDVRDKIQTFMYIHVQLFSGICACKYSYGTRTRARTSKILSPNASSAIWPPPIATGLTTSPTTILDHRFTIQRGIYLDRRR